MSDEPCDAAPDSRADPGEPFVVPITDVFDLHAFRPQEVADAVHAYLEAAIEERLRDVRIIHGRGIGVQRETVRKLLGRHPQVIDFADADPGGGGWGATVVRLRIED